MNTANLVFLHGFPFNSSSWDPQVSYFQNTYYTVAQDLMGLGMGVSTPGPWFLNHYVDDLKSFLDQHDIEKAVLCGVSMGGYIALNFYLSFPDRIDALVLSNTQALGDSNEAKDKRYETVKKILRDGVQDFAESFSKSVLSIQTLNKNPRLQKKLEAMISQQKPENLVRILGALAARKDLSSSVSQIHCPVLVVTGYEDKIISPAVTEKLAKAIPKAHFEKIAGAGHLPNLEQPEEFNRILEDFLESLRGKRQNEEHPYNSKQITDGSSPTIFRK